MALALSITVAIVAGGLASVAGFGIGSLLTPVLALTLGIKLAVAVVAIPHFAATAVRLWTLRRHVDRHIFGRFGLASALGGLVGALALTYVSTAHLVILFGILLVSAGLGAATGWTDRFGLRGHWQLGAGVMSGLLGGIVGNRGGIRSAALLSTNLDKKSLVATGTAIALLVDISRTAIYFATQGHDIVSHWPLVLWMCAGVVCGTLLGRRVLLRVPETLFRRIVGSVILLLGLYMVYRGIWG